MHPIELPTCCRLSEYGRALHPQAYKCTKKKELNAMTSVTTATKYAGAGKTPSECARLQAEKEAEKLKEKERVEKEKKKEAAAKAASKQKACARAASV